MSRAEPSFLIQVIFETSIQTWGKQSPQLDSNIRIFIAKTEFMTNVTFVTQVSSKMLRE
jgi:hypothetical protein